jgi:2-polyprenyl-3-methyl-5-hydroxy-6-metoxy-1,4-benzoquinol methylase
MKIDGFKCKWCSSRLITGPGPTVKPDWYRWKCGGCGSFGYVNPPTSQQLEDIYNEAWDDAESTGTYAAGSTEERISGSLLKAVGYLKYGGSCLDYGAGRGLFTRTVAKASSNGVTAFEPFGKDPQIESVEWISNLADIEHREFDWIFLIEVLEHLENPQETLGDINALLKPGGRLVITTPNAKGLQARFHEFSWREIQNPTHLNLFSSEVLEQCLENSGYDHVSRLLKRVSYKKPGIKSLVLSFTQIFGIDGGLRFIARKPT